MSFHRWEQLGFLDRNNKVKFVCKKCGTITDYLDITDLDETQVLIVTSGNANGDLRTIDRDCEKQKIVNESLKDIESIVDG